MTTPAPDLLVAAVEALAVLSRDGRRACLIGGMVVPRWGEPRATTDVDLSVLAPYGEELPVIESLCASFQSRMADAREFALANRVVLLRTVAGVSLDVALAAFPFELEALDYASDWVPVPGTTVRTCSAEHLIVYKLVAARARDVSDVQGIVRRQAVHLDVERIRRWGREFGELKEDPDLLQPFEAALQHFRR